MPIRTLPGGLVAINTSALADINSKTNSLANLILVRPKENTGIQPQQVYLPPGVPAPNPVTQPQGFLFHFNGEETLVLESDVTDHYAEDNTALQDQISLKPEIFTVHGYVGEFTDADPTIPQFIKTALSKLSLLSPFLPEISKTAQTVYNTAAQTYATALLAGQALGALGLGSVFGLGGLVQTEQQRVFTVFYNYWQNRQLFTVQTPWARLDNMVIKHMRCVQDANSELVSSFEITFKRMRFANTIYISRINVLDGRGANQAQTPVSLGQNALVPGPALEDQVATSFPGLA